MKAITLILATHNHQPIGNFDSVFVRACTQAYEPFLALLERYPGVKVTQHYSGILLDWFRKNRPQILRSIRRLVERGQIEVMGGAHYEAILSVIPDEDKVAQITKLSACVRKEFGVNPKGMWIAERVWEQHLTRWIVEAGMTHLVIDDTHFKHAGFSEDELLGHYVTEELGKSLSVFPISKTLRYAIPFQPPQSTIDYLRSIATEDGNRVVVFADDGEKFGVWPKTFDHVYTNGWLDEFFKALAENADWITLRHFSEVLATLPAAGRTYLPNASYAEMMHWALPAHGVTLYEECENYLKQQGVLEKYGSFVKGGFWRNFLTKYPESNNMHKKMMRVSDRMQDVKAGSKKKIPSRLMDKVLSAQCNDPYWHGVFGGLYLPVLRYPIYHHLISAEGDLDRLTKKKSITIDRTDFDCDGHEEVLVESPVTNWYISPQRGGSVFEFDFKPISLNLLDVISRREEGYHHKLTSLSQDHAASGVASIHDLTEVKEEGLERHLHYDWYRHGSLIDHFFSAETTLDDVWRCKYVEEGDFVNQPYEVSFNGTGRRKNIRLSRNGSIWRDGSRHKISVHKNLTVEADQPDALIEYTIRNEEKDPLTLLFGPEFCFGLQAGNEPDRCFYAPGKSIEDKQLRSKGELAECSVLGLRDEWLGVDVRLECGTPATFWRFPLETVSLSEAGFERIYQGSVLIPLWKFTLEREWHCRIDQRIQRLTKKDSR